MSVTEKQYTNQLLQQQIKNGRLLIIIFGGVYDFEKFIEIHPGGKQVIQKGIGKDCSQQFFESGHLKGANIISTMSRLRVGKMKENSKL